MLCFVLFKCGLMYHNRMLWQSTNYTPLQHYYIRKQRECVWWRKRECVSGLSMNEAFREQGRGGYAAISAKWICVCLCACITRVRTQYREKESVLACIAVCLFISSVQPRQIYVRVHTRLWHYMCVCFQQRCAESVLCEIGSGRWNVVFAGKLSLHTQTLTLSDFRPFLISACLHSSLVSKCRSSDLQGSGVVPDHVDFLCMCVFSVVQCLV